MWKCDKCGEEIETQFTECWKCAGVEYHKNFVLTEVRCPFCGSEVLLHGMRHVVWEGDNDTIPVFVDANGTTTGVDCIEGRNVSLCTECEALLMSGLDEL